MFCFSVTGFIILPQLGKSWLWPFRAERQFIVRWFQAKKGKLKKVSQFRDSEKKYFCNESVTNESIQITTKSQSTVNGKDMYLFLNVSVGETG